MANSERSAASKALPPAPWEVWLLRVLWLLVPIVAGPGLTAALDPLDGAPATVLEIAAWAFWFLGLVATLVPHPVTLTAIRIVAPAVAAAGLVMVAASGESERAALVVVVGYGLILTVVALLPSVGDAMVNGSAYGSERRMALRTPGPTLLGPIQLAWLTVVTGPLACAILVAQGRLLIAAAAAAVAAGTFPP